MPQEQKRREGKRKERRGGWRSRESSRSRAAAAAPAGWPGTPFRPHSAPRRLVRLSFFPCLFPCICLLLPFFPCPFFKSLSFLSFLISSFFLQWFLLLPSFFLFCSAFRFPLISYLYYFYHFPFLLSSLFPFHSAPLPFSFYGSCCYAHFYPFILSLFRGSNLSILLSIISLVWFGFLSVSFLPLFRLLFFLSPVFLTLPLSLHNHYYLLLPFNFLSNCFLISLLSRRRRASALPRRVQMPSAAQRPTAEQRAP